MKKIIASTGLWNLSTGVLFVAAIGLLWMPNRTVGQEGVQRKGGKQFKVRDKVVVINSNARIWISMSDYPDRSKSKTVPFFSVFFKLPNVLNQPENLVRVGNSQGVVLGFIEKSGKGVVLDNNEKPVEVSNAKYLQDWNTRYVILPVQSDTEKINFTLTDVEVNGKPVIDKLALPQRYQSHENYAYVLDIVNKDVKDDDKKVYKVLLAAGLNRGSTGTPTTVEPEDVKLEIVFVLESSDFMKKPFNGRPLLSYLQEVVKSTVAELKKDKELAKAIRLGIVQYWDNVQWVPGDKRKVTPAHQKEIEALSPLFPATVACKLTNSPEEIEREINALKVVQMRDDWPDDVIAGLNTAVEKIQWSKASIKQVILVGSAACQLEAKGVYVNQYDNCKENSYTGQGKDGTQPRGYNSTGLSIQQLIDKAQAQGSGLDSLLSRKRFHALFLPNEIVNLQVKPYLLSKEKEQRVLQLAKKLILAQSAKEVSEQVVALRKEGCSDDLINQAARYHLVKHQASLARAHYEQLVTSRDGRKGFFREVEPTGEDVKRASDQLAARIRDAFRELKDLREGIRVKPASSNPVAEDIRQLNKVLEQELKKRGAESFTGKASLRSNGKEVGQRMIFVSKSEMLRMNGILRDLHTSFTKLGGNRADIKKTLDTLKESLGRQGIGELDRKEKIDEETLESLIDLLPMRTQALQFTVKDIVSWGPSQFTRWLKQIDHAAKRCQSLHDKTDDWIKLTQGAVPNDDYYAFFPVTIFP